MAAQRRQRRILAVDPGRVRVGLAVSDALGISLTPVGVIKGGDDTALRIARAAFENNAGAVIVGHPINMDGTEGLEARKARKLAVELASRLHGMDVYLWDERLTSFQATDILVKADRKPGRNKALVDVVSAQLILRSFIDAELAGEHILPVKPADSDADSRT